MFTINYSRLVQGLFVAILFYSEANAQVVLEPIERSHGKEQVRVLQLTFFDGLCGDADVCAATTVDLAPLKGIITGVELNLLEGPGANTYRLWSVNGFSAERHLCNYTVTVNPDKKAALFVRCELGDYPIESFINLFKAQLRLTYY